MPVNYPHPAKARLGIVLFFGSSIAIGLAVAMLALRHGESLGAAIFTGSIAGFFGTWVSLVIGVRTFAAVKRFR
jgi:hypothetical protein